MTKNISGEFPLSASYERGAKVIKPFAAGVGSIAQSEMVMLHIPPTHDAQSAAEKELRDKYSILEIDRILSDGHGPDNDEATVEVNVGLLGDDAKSPNLNLRIRFKSVRVGRRALEGLDNSVHVAPPALEEPNSGTNDALREALTEQLTPLDYWLFRPDREEDYALLSGGFGSSEERLPSDEKAMKVAATIIDIAHKTMSGYEPEALDRTATANRGLFENIPIGIVMRGDGR